jgi:hypothetical protein
MFDPHRSGLSFPSSRFYVSFFLVVPVLVSFFNRVYFLFGWLTQTVAVLTHSPLAVALGCFLLASRWLKIDLDIQVKE